MLCSFAAPHVLSGAMHRDQFCNGLNAHFNWNDWVSPNGEFNAMNGMIAFTYFLSPRGKHWEHVCRSSLILNWHRRVLFTKNSSLKKQCLQTCIDRITFLGFPGFWHQPCSMVDGHSMNSGPNSKSYRRRKARTVFSDQQLQGLEKRFECQRYLSTPERIELAAALNLSETQVC